MSPSTSSPTQTPLTTSDEPQIRSAQSLLHICHDYFAKHTTQQPDSPSSSSQSLAPPTPPGSSTLSSTSTSMSAIPSKIQPNPASQNLSTASMSFRQSITPSFSFPGSSSSATTYDRIFPDSTDSHCTLITASSSESISATSQRMPNVYINGLPPHFSEQDLFALTRPFGDIKSVRTFTRHVSEKPTGYGFVLFNDLESAQRCIEGLRKQRNLHPSFSKQVHRIPGTEYAQSNAAQSTDQDENTFKARMEKLKDSASTNLYIEGLPLSIDEESLTALILPYKIKSSRFFKTKLSNPPRIIAFVRLETRAAAEDTIERLHGRMVRGWNDPGCRISVRFADSAEQRELRRAERIMKSGDQSPARLTIAQAALLNLRGQDLQANIRDVSGGKPQRVSIPRSNNQATALSPSSDSGLLPTSRSLPSQLRYTYKKSPLPSTSDLPVTAEMDSLLQSIQNMGYDDGSLDSTMRSSALDNNYLMTQQAQLQALTSAALLSPNPLPITLPRGHTQARNGFTPAEELILEAHAQRLQFQAHPSTQSSPIFEPISSLRKLTSNVRGSDPASREPFPASGLAASGRAMFSQDALPTISEDDFHAMGHPPCTFVPTSHRSQGSVNSCPPDVPATINTISMRPPNRAVSIVPPPPDYEDHGKRHKGQHHRAERSIGSKQTTYSSPSFNNQSTASGESKSHPSLLQQIYTKQSPQLGEQHSAVKEGARSPAVVSPALTYSSRTPSTLSPATPFFGSFAGSQDAFEVLTIENEEMAERKLKARVANK